MMTVKLNDLLLPFFADADSLPDVAIHHITNDSRNVKQNTLFLAYPGEKADGRKYISQAVLQGACAIIYDPSDAFLPTEKNIPCVPVVDLKIKQSHIAARFYDFPSQKIPVIGVTGTNGKTSITHFIAQALQKKCGVVGTLGYGFLEAMKKTVNTTPDGLQLQKMFSELCHDGASAIAMEVSSHALIQQRVNDVQFHTAVFTNLTQDHLDFHETMENYRAAKALLFETGVQNAVINLDDETGKYYIHKYRTLLNIMTYSLSDKSADIFVTQCTPTQTGFDVRVKTRLEEGEFHCPLIGGFNISNALAVLGVLLLLKTSFHDALQQLSQLKNVNGRMQVWHFEKMPAVVVDYAHTPDALEKVLQSVRAHCSGKLWCVFGCGGNRDRGKRAKMGAIAEKLSDRVIVTNDNPRHESPDVIANDILSGMQDKNNCWVELDRVHAIEKAIQSADDHDWIVVAGKGHETEQIIGDKILVHNDNECVIKLLKKR